MSMRSLILGAGVSALVAFAANAGPFHGIHDTSSARGLEARGIMFQNTLYDGYIGLSRSRRGGFDLRDAEYFNHKARFAEERSPIQPDELGDRALADADVPTFYTALGRLYRVFDRGGRMLAPVDTGNAQVSYDCWIEAAEAGRDEDAERCQAAFEQAMAAAEAAATIDPEAIRVVLGEAMPGMESDFLVFFDWDSAALTPEALGILETAAENAQTAGTARLEATGHADRSGPEDYNMGLSERRAEAVRDELVRLGIPADRIFIFWRGETEPLVPTPDGVREPQNRRVEIVLM
jgi:OOP family OmpA-OmpF porin